MTPHETSMNQAVARLDELRAVERLMARDASLFADDEATRRLVRQRLGWVRAHEAMADHVERLAAFARVVERHGHDRVLVIGMGGSGLWPEVLGRHLRTKRGLPVRTLDTTHPGGLADAMAWCKAGKPLFVLASKSGTTVETRCLHAVLRQTWPEGRSWVAITDEGSDLQQLAADEGFRDVFINPSDIGGRFSAQSFFGLVPAALAGVDLRAALERIASMAEACAAPEAALNPAAQLAAFLAGGVAEGRDQLRVMLGRDVRAFGSWIEQLVAESTGKQGQGVLPIPEPATGAQAPDPSTTPLPAACVVGLTTFAQPDAPRVEAARQAGVPTEAWVMPEPADLWAEVYRWECATALLGVLLGINPFDEPNVRSAKDATAAVLEGRGEPEGPALTFDVGRLVDIDGPLAGWLEELSSADTLVVLAWLAPTEVNQHRLESLRTRLEERTEAAVSTQFGPRYLHSTGQLHKGGPGRGRFVFVHDLHDVEGDDAGPVVPGRGYRLARLCRAQAMGDVMALQQRGRTVAVGTITAAS